MTLKNYTCKLSSWKRFVFGQQNIKKETYISSFPFKVCCSFWQEQNGKKIVWDLWANKVCYK